MKNKFLVMVLGACLSMNTISLALAAETATQDSTAVASTSSELPAEPPEESYDNLRLTSEQKQQVEPLLAQRKQEINAIMHDESLSQEEKQAQADEVRAASREDIDQYLTPEQKAKADSVRTQNDARRTEARVQQETIAADKQQLKQDRQQLKADAQSGDKTAVEEDKANMKEDRKNLASDKQAGRANRQQHRQSRRAK